MKHTKIIVPGAIIAGVLMLGLLYVAPTGNFFQSNVFQSTYTTRDTGLYLGKEETAGTGKVLKADQGMRTRSVPGKVGEKNMADLYLEVVNNSTDISANSLKLVLSYNANELTIGELSSISPMPGITLDTEFTTIMKNEDGSERGTLYLGLDKVNDFSKPVNDAAKIRFVAVNNDLRSSAVSLNTLRLYKREALSDYTNPTLYVKANEGDTTVQQAHQVIFDGTYSEVTESTLADGGTKRVEVIKDYAGNVLKTIETIYDNKGRVTRIYTTLANGDTELFVYEYTASGSYTVTITKVIGGVTTTTVKYYDKNGIEINEDLYHGSADSQNSNTNTSTGTTVNGNNNANGSSSQNTGTGTTMNNNSNGSTSTGSTVTDTSVCVPSDPFVDMSGHWSVNYVEQARLKCIVGGKFAGLFAPDDFVTRAELTKMAVEAFELPQVASTSETGFLDVRIADWFANYVATARKANVIQGYADATYRPNAYINRAEALKIILEAQSIAKGTNTNFTTVLDNWRAQFPTYTYVQFSDTPVAQWFAKYVLYAWQNDVVEGYQDASGVLFKPGQNITRAEVIKIIMEML